MHLPSLTYLNRLLAFWLVIFFSLILITRRTYGMEFVPVIGILWRHLFYLICLIFPICLFPLALASIYKRNQCSWKRKILHVIPWVMALAFWGFVGSIAFFTLSFDDALTNGVFSLRCLETDELFYLRDGNSWMDDDSGSINRTYTLYRRRLLTLEPLASAGVHTRVDAGYIKTDVTSSSTMIELQPIQTPGSETRYVYAPALKELVRCK